MPTARARCCGRSRPIADAIEEINDMDADDFFEHVVKKHPAPQAPRYIWKLQKALDAM